MVITYLASNLSRLIAINEKEWIKSVSCSLEEFNEIHQEAEDSGLIDNYDGAWFEVKGQDFSVHYDPALD